MLCPEVSNFPPPKVMTTSKKFGNLDKVIETLKLNNFYKSLIVTLPDVLNTPTLIEKSVTDDSDYYKIRNCSITEFIEPTFIEKFVKNGRFNCLTANRNCMVQNCAAITPDGKLTLHILQYIFQTIGLEGTKRPHNFYEVKIDLHTIKQHEKLKHCLSKLENFDFYLSWEPHEEDICPSTVAKYLYEKNIDVSVHALQLKKINPVITELPSIKDVEADEMTEWIGMLVHEGDLAPTETYISNYGQPESEYTLKTSRVSILVVKGFITSTLVNIVCRNLDSYVKSRELENYWVSISVQSNDDGIFQWNPSSPRMFQAHDSSCNVFFTQDCQMMYSIGQLKFS